MHTSQAQISRHLFNHTRVADSELQISTRLVSAALILGGFAALVASELEAHPSQPLELSFVLGCYLASVLIEVAWNHHPTYGRWVAVVLTSILVPIGTALWATPGLMVLIPVPAILALGLLGIRGSTVATVLVSATLGLASGFALSPLGIVSTLVTMLLLWFTLGILVAIYRPIVRLGEWVYTYTDRVQKLLDEARYRNAELNQALSELVHVNRQLDLANERLAAARAVAEEAQKSKANFVAKVSHEFRTPLNMIIGLSDFIARQVDFNSGYLPSEVLKDIQVIHRNSEHLSALINDVLDLSQAEAGQIVLHRQWVNLVAEVANAVDVVRPLLEKKGLAVQLAMQEDLPQVYCDPVRIRQVLLNLLSNAARHTQAGFVKISAEPDGRYVTVKVSDSGPGIATQDLKHIFEPFWRGERMANGQGRGSGLGLTVCKQLIELHNGTIWVESQVGKGSTFAFRLPQIPLSTPISRPCRWIDEDWVWKERTFHSDLPKAPVEWRVILLDSGGQGYSVFSKLTTDDVELIETQTLDEAVTQHGDIPAHVIIVNEEEPAELWSRLFEAKTLIPDTPIVGCSWPLAAAHQKTPDIMDYLIKPVTRADLREALESLPKPARRVLVVDDDPDVRELFSRILHEFDASLEIATAADGDEALARMREGSWDLVLLDIVMPRRDGWSVLHEKQAIPHMREVPVLVMSAQDPDIQTENSPILAVTTPEGVSHDLIVETTFRLAARLRARSGIPDPVSPETVAS